MRYLFFILFVFQLNAIAQNLVPNSSFEGYNPCSPNSGCIRISQASNACISSCCSALLPESPFLVNGGAYNWWAVGGYSLPFYVNKCIFDTRRIVQPQFPTTDAWFIPRTGSAFLMINSYGWGFNIASSNLRQFAQVKLTAPMQAGCSYELSCYALLTKNYGLFIENPPDLTAKQTAADGLGMYVSADSVSMENPANDPHERFLDYVPQVSNPAGRLLTDSIHYQKVSGIYVAQGGEQWLVIGNFKDNAHTQTDYNGVNRKSIYLIDDVSIMEWKPNLVSFTDTTICADSTLKIVLPEGLKNYKWSTGETSRQISIATPGIYTVEASNGCTILRDTFRIQRVIHYTEPLDIGKDTFFCEIPAAFHIDAPSNFDSFYWSTGSVANNITIQTPGIYWLDATYSCGTLRDSIKINEFVYPDTILIPASDTVICSNAFLDIRLLNTTDYRNFLWNTGSTEDHLLIHAAGEYSIDATSVEGCHVKDTLLVDMEYPPVLSMQSDTALCVGSILTATVTVNGTYNTVEWQDGVQGVTRIINASGLYSVNVSNECYTISESIQVSFVDCTLNIPNLITVNNDGKNDFFKIETSIYRPLHVVIYNSWGGVVYDNVDYKNDWNGKELAAGIYFYSIRDSFSDNVHKGWLQIIR
jgi:gliding motility-associated-like protein